MKVRLILLTVTNYEGLEQKVGIGNYKRIQATKIYKIADRALSFDPNIKRIDYYYDSQAGLKSLSIKETYNFNKNILIKIL